MSTHGGQVTLSIGGRPYTVACAAGEEDHIKRLAALVDEKMAQLGSARAPQASQNLLFCALLLADDLHERTAELAEVSASLAHVGRDRGASDDPALAPALEHFAEMLEKCADGLEGRLGSAAAMH